MKLKNILLSGLSLVLVAALAIGGTVAYLTSDDSDVNVMTLGNVKIAQHEYERATNDDGSYKTATIDNVASYVLKEFSQGKPLLPATVLDANGDPHNYGAGSWDTNNVVRMTQVGSYGSMQVFASKNAQDKFVTVENTGKTDAYVRTLVALEMGNLEADRFDDVISNSARSTKDNNDFSQPWLQKNVGVINVDGNNYVLIEFVYHGAALSDGSYRHANGVLPAGDTSYPNLCQVYMRAAATNEDCEKLDGNNNGTYDILVLSQAVQAAGFDNAETALDTAFGDVTAANAATWFGGMELTPTRNPAKFTVTTTEEAQAALDAAIPGDTIHFAAGNYGMLYFRQSAASVVVRDRDYADSAYEEVKLRTFEDLTITADDGAIIDGFMTEAQTYYNTAHSNSTVYPILDSFIEIKNVKIDGVKFSGEADALNFDGKVSVNGLTVTNCTMERARNVDPDYTFIVQKGNGADAKYTVNGETFTVQFTNVTVDSCVADYVDRFILAYDTKNLTVTNNKASNVSQHFINLQAGKTDHTGVITITGNTYTNGFDRFFRAAYLADAKLVVERNTVNNAFYGNTPDADELDLVKVNVRADSAFTFTNFENKINTSENTGATFVPTVQ